MTPLVMQRAETFLQRKKLRVETGNEFVTQWR